MSELETIRQEIDRLQKQLDQLQKAKKADTNYKSAGIYRLISSSNGNHVMEDKMVLRKEINSHMRFDTKEDGEQAVTQIEKLLKMMAIANYVTGDEGYDVDLEDTFVFMTDDSKERFEQIYFEEYRNSGE